MEKISKAKNIFGEVNLPGSKSYSHRILITCYILNIPCEINNLNYCDDVKETISILSTMGGKFILDEANKKISFISREITTQKIKIEVKESASTIRFLFPILLYYFNDVTIVLSPILEKRKCLDKYQFLINKNGIEVEKNGFFYHFIGKIREDDIEIGDVDSSQYLSGLLFLLTAFKSSHFLKLPKYIPSSPYLNMTIDTLEKMGVKYVISNNLIVKNFVMYQKRNTYLVEADFSSLSYFASLASLGGLIKINNININSLQGDKQILNILMDMGELFILDKDYILFKKGVLRGIEISIDNCIDLGPILMILGAFAYGKTILKNVNRLQNKESNRISSMVNELKKANVDIQYSSNEIVVTGKASYQGDFNFSTYHDHRIAMALVIFALLNDGTCSFDDLECVGKSYREFLIDLERIINNE